MSAQQFIGSEVQVTLSDGRIVEGVVENIDASKGLLKLANAGVRRFDGSRSPVKGGTIEVDKGSVKDLQLLSLSTSHASPQSHPSASTSAGASAQTFSSAPTYTSASTPEPDYSPSKPRGGPKSRKKDRSKNYASPHGGSGYESGDPASAPTPPPQPADFSKDFDFQGGLQAFDKAKVWAEIKLADTTDPASRLVSHNRKPREDAMRKLANDEMVLSSEEQLVNGIVATALSAPAGSSSQPSVPAPPTQKKGPGLSALGIPVHFMTLDQLTDALQSASVDTGPNLVQRVENGGRAIASYALTVLGEKRQQRYEPATPQTVAVLASCGLKGSYALRAGAHLANRGCKVMALIVSPSRPPPAFEFYIRLLMAGGGDVVSRLQTMPQTCDLVIEALADNATSAPSPSTDPTIVPPNLDPPCVTYTHHKPTLSIDMPSNVDYDTGQIVDSSSPAPYATHIVCLGGLPRGMLSLPHSPAAICLADLSLPARCYQQAGLVDWQAPWGQEWETMFQLRNK